VFDVKADAEAVLSAMGAPAKVQILRGAAAGGTRAATG
jgi:phenylalanyl-tRNA synthetase beta chain